MIMYIIYQMFILFTSYYFQKVLHITHIIQPTFSLTKVGAQFRTFFYDNFSPLTSNFSNQLNFATYGRLKYSVNNINIFEKNHVNSIKENKKKTRKLIYLVAKSDLYVDIVRCQNCILTRLQKKIQKLGSAKNSWKKMQ